MLMSKYCRFRGSDNEAAMFTPVFPCATSFVIGGKETRIDSITQEQNTSEVYNIEPLLSVYSCSKRSFQVIVCQTYDKKVA